MQLPADFLLRRAGRRNGRVVLFHVAQQLCRAQFRIDQPIFQPPQRGLRFQQPAGTGQQPAWIIQRSLEQLQQFLVRIDRSPVRAQLGFDFAGLTPQTAFVAGSFVEDSQLGQVGAGLALDRRQRFGRSIQVGLGQRNGLGQLVDHALIFLIPQVVELLFELPADRTVQRDRTAPGRRLGP